MKLILILTTLLIAGVTQAGVYFEVNWTKEFKKELIISCDNGSGFCHNLCGQQNQCIESEGACRDCIGTSLMMTNIIGELGRTIVNSGRLSIVNDFLSMIGNSQYATLAPNDIYNVIDASGSIRAMKKFEQLCPEGSLDQLVFLKVDVYTRKVSGPQAVYCLMEEGSHIYDLTGRPDVIINERNFLPLY